MRLVLALVLALAADLARAGCHDLLITPDVVALVRGEDARLRPVFKGPHEPLESHINGQKGNWDYRRESVVVPLRLVYDAYGGRLGPGAAWLPIELRGILRAGGRFETTDDPRVASAYALWMMAPPEGSNRRGRTGTLLHRGRPLIITNPSSGAQYVVEIKGAGLPTGGYAASTRYQALQGGLWERHGEVEFTRLGELLDDLPGDSVKGLAYQRFRGRFGGQDLLYRLTPGNLRASLRGADALERTPAQTDVLVEAVGVQLGEILARGHFAYTHPENFVVDGNGTRAWLTDLLDVLPLRQLPRTVESVVADEFFAVAMTLTTAQYLSEYRAEPHWAIFWSAVVRTLVSRDVIPPEKAPALEAEPDAKHAALALLRAGLAERIVRERRRVGYDPTDDQDLARVLNAPCSPPEPREHGRRVINMYRNYPRDTADPETVAMVDGLVAEAERLAQGEVTFMQWLKLPTTKLMLAINASLDLTHAYLPLDAHEPFDFVRHMTQDAIPGWFELKRHIEREFSLLNFALESHPNDPELSESFEAIQNIAKWYIKGLGGDLVELMCTDRAELRRRFKLPYHR